MLTASPTVPAEHPALASLTGTIDDVLLSVLRPAPCDFCPAIAPTYTDPETGCRFCLDCLEAALDQFAASYLLKGNHR